jgi:hypothetical protein
MRDGYLSYLPTYARPCWKAHVNPRTVATAYTWLAGSLAIRFDWLHLKQE